MPIIRERIKFENQDVNLKINLGINNSFSGYQQEINDLTEETKIEITNPIIDNEVRRFRYGGSAMNLFFYFTVDGTTYINSFSTTGAGFTSTEISDNASKILNSFYTMDFYDTFNNYTQTKIFTIYQTQILSGEKSSGTPIPKYNINSNNTNQFYSWYIPKSFIDQNIATGSTTITGYIKFNFYSAKSGKVLLFYNKDNQNLKTPEKLYFKVSLDLINMTWRFVNGGDKKAYQIPITNAYYTKVNNSVDNFDNKKQKYPEGNTFIVDTNPDYVIE